MAPGDGRNGDGVDESFDVSGLVIVKHLSVESVGGVHLLIELVAISMIAIDPHAVVFFKYLVSVDSEYCMVSL